MNKGDYVNVRTEKNGNIIEFTKLNENLARYLKDTVLKNINLNFTVIYHIDNDGIFGAEMLTWLTEVITDKQHYVTTNHEKLARYFACNYGASPSEDGMFVMNNDSVVVITDYRLPFEQFQKVVENSKHTLWIDHHKTSRDDIMHHRDIINKYIEEGKLSVSFNMHRCGTMIMNNVLHRLYPREFVECTDTIPKLSEVVRLIDIYDRCSDRSIKEAWYLNAYTFKSADAELNSPIWMDICSEPGFAKAMYFGEKLYANAWELNELVYEAFSKETIFHDLKCRVLYGYGNGYVFNDHEKEYDAVIIYHQVSNGKYKYSIFSANGADIEKIASSYGGGGHASAAGFTIDDDLFNDR